MVFDSSCCYHYVVAITITIMYAITMLPSRLTVFCSARAIARWKVAEALHTPKGIRRHSKRPSLQEFARTPTLSQYSCRSLPCPALKGFRQFAVVDKRL